MADTPAGVRRYFDWFGWLAEDEPARKQQRFDAMSRGWIIGATQFAQEIVREHAELAGHGPRLAVELQVAREAVWQSVLNGVLRRLSRRPGELSMAGKSIAWKLAVAAALKERTTATNRWIARHLHMGNHQEVSRKVNAWMRSPDPTLLRKIR